MARFYPSGRTVMWFFQTQNYFGQQFGQMAIFRVLRQKHVVFPTSKLFWAEIWTNWDILGALLKNLVFSNSKWFRAEIWRNGDIPGAFPETCGFFKFESNHNIDKNGICLYLGEQNMNLS